MLNSGQKEKEQDIIISFYRSVAYQGISLSQPKVFVEVHQC